MFKKIILSCFFSIRLFAAFQSLEELTLEEKVGQLLMVHFNGSEVNQDATRLIEQVHVGGFIYYNWANDLDSPFQVWRLSRGLQQIACRASKGIPLFIAVDQEGGRICRLSQGGFTPVPSNAALGSTRKPELARKSALAVGRELRAVGINVNLAPVVDVNSNPENPVIGDRSFSANVEEVAAFGEAALEGYRQAQIISCLKHYPGHGDVSVDPHGNLPVVNKTMDELAATELFPFRFLANKADMVMTGHLMVPKLDQRNCATLSRTILDRMLRRAMRYQGIIISDSLVMQGVLDNCSGKVENAALRAFLAGCDILLLGGKQLLTSQDGFELTIEDVIAVHRHLVEAVRSGKISEKRLNDSVGRILKLKRYHQAFANLIPQESELLRWVGYLQPQKLAEAIVRYHSYSIEIPFLSPIQEQIGH